MPGMDTYCAFKTDRVQMCSSSIFVTDVSLFEAMQLNEEELHNYLFRCRTLGLFKRGDNTVYEIIKYGLRSKKFKLCSSVGCSYTSVIDAVCKYRVRDLFRFIVLELKMNIMNTFCHHGYAIRVDQARVSLMCTSACIAMFYKNVQEFSTVLDALLELGMSKSWFCHAAAYHVTKRSEYLFAMANRGGDRLYGRFDRFPRPPVWWLYYGKRKYYLARLCVLLAVGYVRGIYFHDELNQKMFPSRFCFQYLIGVRFKDSAMSQCILNSGFVVKPIEARCHDVQWLKTKSSISELNMKMSLFVTQTRRSPLALQQQSANVVRNALRPNAAASVDKLMLPAFVNEIVTLGLTIDNCGRKLDNLAT